MSELSPGSKATTNVFMVLGIIALIALMVAQGLAPDKQPDFQDCSDRITLPDTLNSSGSEAITVRFALQPDGSVTDISVDKGSMEATQEIGRILNTAIAAPTKVWHIGQTIIWCEHRFRQTNG